MWRAQGGEGDTSDSRVVHNDTPSAGSLERYNAKTFDISLALGCIIKLSMQMCFWAFNTENRFDHSSKRENDQ